MKPELKKLLILNAPYLLFVYLFDKIGQAVRLSPGADLSGKVLSLADGFSAAFANPLPSLAPMDLLIGIAGAVLIRLMVYFKGKNAKKYRKGIEYGSARWGNAEDIKPYTDPVFQNNVLLTQTERLTMNSRPKQPKYARNKNILVIGGSGSGKTRFFVKPNLMQMHSSYVVTDPKGTVLVECGKLLQRGGYRIKVLNTINFKKSMKYNPFAYLRSEKDILKLVNTLIANTKGDGEKAGEDFWVKSERLFYCALIGYIWYEAPEEEKNFTTLLEMINASEAREDDPEFQSPVDLMFERLEEKDPEHFAVRQYKKFLLSAGKTRSSILISCGARLAPFDIKELRDLMETDEMELDTIGDRKTALFVIISDTDDTFNFVVSILYTQLFNLLCDKADDEYGGRLPVHVRCLLDEFANIGQIPKFEKLIATIRSREISASIILQSQSQLKAIYKDNADTIVGNCDTTLFLGGKEKTTLKEMSEILGKETIDSFNTSENRGREVSHGLNYQKLRRTIRQALSQAASFDEFSSLLLREGVTVKESRGRLSYLTPDRTKPITARKLGDDFDKAAVLALLTQNAHRAAEQTTAIPEYPHTQKGRLREEKAAKTTPADNTLQRMVDREAKRAEGKGVGYDRWAAKHNLKQMAATVTAYQQYGFSSPEELDEACSAAYAAMQESLTELKQVEKTLNGKKELQRQVLAYSKTRPVRDGLKQQKNAKAKAAYRQKHESDFIIADAAARYFRENGISKLPSYKALQAEIESLIKEKNSGYNDYRAKREEYRRLQTVKGNIDQILHRERKPVKRQEQER